MNMKLLPKLGLVIWAASLLFTLRSSGAEATANEILVRYFYEPELIQQLQDKLTLTQDQKFALQVELKVAKDRVAYLQGQIRQETQRLIPLVSPDQVDEDAVLAQSKKILDLEQEIKHVQLKLLVHLKNKLTPQQQAVLKPIKARQLALQAKLLKAQAMILQQQQEGRDLSALTHFKQEFETLVKQGQFEKAEIVIDRTLTFLEGNRGK